MTPGRNSVERIRRHEVSRALKKVNLSPEEAGIIDLLSRSLVRKLLDGPISEVVARAEAEISLKYRTTPETSYALESHGNGVEVSGPRSRNDIRESRTGTSRAGGTGSPASLREPLERREEPVPDPSLSPGSLALGLRDSPGIVLDSFGIHRHLLNLASRNNARSYAEGTERRGIF